MPDNSTSFEGIAMFKILLTALCVLSLMGCDSQSPPENALNTPPVTAPEDPPGVGLDAREQDLAQREAELAMKEREDALARRESELAEKQRLAATPTQTRPAPSRSTAAPVPSRPRTQVAQAPTRVTVPAGTQLTVQLSSEISSRTAKPGDTFEARLFEDIMVGGKVAVPSGGRVTGTVTNVISGSDKIGGVPTLGLRFDYLETLDGQRIGINGELVQQGKSDTGRDTAKILGGAAAGAVIGHQVEKDDKGKIIGGILGGAIGAIAAKKTGTEVELPPDSTLTIALAAPIEVAVK
jgi:hypothetical protein